MAETLRELGVALSPDSSNFSRNMRTINAISERLEKELPGLKGFSARSLRYMRTFYEEWISLDNCTPALPDNDPLNLAPAGAKFETNLPHLDRKTKTHIL